MRGLSSDEEDDGDPPKNLKCKETFREDGISLSSFLIPSSYRSRLLEPYDVNEIPTIVTSARRGSARGGSRARV